MTSLLIMTVGQTDVQLVHNGQRQKLDGKTCGKLLDELKQRVWSLVNAPKERNPNPVKELPEGVLTLCTPKLDAVLAHLSPSLPSSVLILETTRQDQADPRLAGEVLERRFRERGVENVTRIPFLTGNERLEDPSNDIDSVVRRSVVATLSDAIAQPVKTLGKNDRVFVATTGGLSAANDLINELVRLHAVGGPRVTVLEVPDGYRADRAVEEKFHPAAGYRARWHALSLVEKGNLLGAWGAVSHLQSEPGQEWTRVIQWLAHFASSLPLPPECNLAILNHPRLAVRAALRVELALRAHDIPRAVHGTVAFFESALWDHLTNWFQRTGQRHKGREILHLKGEAQAPTGKKLLRNDEPDEKEKRNCPFEFEVLEGRTSYFFFEDGAGRFARDYAKSDPLKKLSDAVNGVKYLRDDVAHNEPTPPLMEDAGRRMREAALWSTHDTFLSQPKVQNVLRELGEPDPARMVEELLAEVRAQLIAV